MRNADVYSKQMDTARYKKRLVDKENELRANIARLESEGRQARVAEVEDPIDAVTSSEGQAAAFEAGSIEYRTIADVREALRRIDDGVYGTCIDCSRPIEAARLEAVPWTPYCRADQEKHEAAGDQYA